MYNSVFLSVKQEQFNRYSKAFSFFQSKSISMLVNSRRIDYVLLLRDLQIFDDETEYFKRYYSLKEAASRVLKLISYYEANMTPPQPILILINTFKILETRKRKHIRLIVMREKSLARRAEAEVVPQQQNNEQRMILQQLEDSNFSEVSSNKEQASDQDAYDSDLFNAYQQQDDLRSTDCASKQTDIFNFKTFYQSQIILDFHEDAVKEQPKINILPPVPLPVLAPLPPVETISTGVQTSIQEFPPKKIAKQIEAIKPVQIPQLTKEMAMTPISQMGLRSELKKQNAVLTDSIEMIHRRQQREKARASTFMEYYNSQPVKSPSNILQKFIKRKK